MAAIKNIYLYYHKEIQEPDTWDFKFSYFFGIIFNQITGIEVKVFSNLDVTQSQVMKLDFLDTQKIDAFVIIQNSGKNLFNTTQKLSELSDSLKNIPSEKIFQVLKLGSAGQTDTSFTSEFQQYKFYELNHRTMKLIEYDPDTTGDSEKGFWEKLSDLAYDIKSINTDYTERNIRGNTIFLAEVSDDQQKNREKIKRELLLLGYRVLPTSPLPRKFEDFENTVTSQLFDSILSVNILGEMYGESPQLADYSYVELQNRIFEKESNAQKKLPIEPKIHRIIWTPPKMDISDDKQYQYIKRIQKETLSVQNTEFVQSTITDLVEIVEKKIKQIKSEGFEFINEEHKSNVCILYDTLTPEQIEIIRKKFESENIIYFLYPVNNTHLSSVEEWLHEFKFKNNFLIINSEKGQSWVSSLLALIVRAKGLADALPILSLIVLSTDTDKSYNYLAPVEVQLILYRPFKLDEQLSQILNKVKL